MGACYDQRVYPGTLTKEEVKKRFKDDQASDCYENGHSYSGTIGMERKGVDECRSRAVRWLRRKEKGQIA